MTYRLGRRSRRELKGVHPDLVSVVYASIADTTQDFAVHDGIRSAKEQFIYYSRGASRIDGYRRISRHQRQADGYGHAVDLVPYINGKLRWEWEPIFDIAEAVQRAAIHLDVPIRWGGSWSFLNRTNMLPREMNRVYVDRKLRQGRRAFSDGPHFEIHP